MRLGLQIVSALLLATGIGLLGLAGSRVSLVREFGNPADIDRARRIEEQYNAERIKEQYNADRRTAAARYIERTSDLQGWGAGLTALGTVGLIAPWVNILVARRGLAASAHLPGRSE